TNGVEYLHGSKANDAQSLPEPTVITVGYGVATIQQAIDNSIHDDLIEVPPGVYNEAVDFKGKRIIVSNLSAAYGYWSLVEQTVIDASGLSGPAVTFSEGDDPSGLLFGVAVRGGTVGVLCNAAAEPWILNCLITSNDTDGVRVMAGSPRLASSKVLGNGAHGIHISGGQAQVLNNWIDGNAGDGIHVAETMSEPGVEIRNNTITNNGTIGIRSDAEVSPAVSNCILWGNDVNDLQGCDATYSCIERGHLGEGNIAADPRLIDLGYGSYILDPNSPCIDAGGPSDVGEGELDLEARPRLFGVTVDIGACEFSPTAMADRRLPYMTSFEGCQGYTYWKFWGDLRGQDGWRVPDGRAWVYGYVDYTTEDWLGRHPIVQAAFIDANSIVSRTFVSVGQHHRHVRCTISPWYGAEVRVVNGDNTIAAVRFGSDRDLYVYNNGQFEDTGDTWYYPGCQYWSSPDMPWGRELHLVLDYGTNSYKVYYGGQHVADADFAQPFSTLTEFEVRSGYGFIGLDRVSISDEPLGDLQLSITQPCACEDDEIEGRIAVKGKLWWDRLGLYQLAYCPASWIEREEDLLDQWRWTIFDTGDNVVPSGGTLGYWDTTAIPNGYYYLGVIVYSDSGVASIHVLTKELYYHGQLIYADWAPVAVSGELKSGAFAHREAPDVAAPWPGQFPFELTRSYNSMNRFQEGPFGLGWTHNWDVYLVEDTRFHYHRTHDTGAALWAAHDGGDIGLGQVYVRYPDGSSKLFVCKEAPDNEGRISPAKYVPRATEDTSGEYLLRTTTVSASDRLESIRYTLYTRDGTELVFETGSLVDQDITPPLSGGGAVDWAAKATLKRMEDRFGNAVDLTWNQNHTLVTQISNGRHAILFDPDANDHYQRVRLYRVADVNEPAQLLQTVEYGVDYDCLRTVSRPGKGVDGAGRMGSGTTEHVTGYGYYYAGQLINIEYDYHGLSYAPDIEILYDEAGRMVWRRDYLSADQGTDTEYDYSYYHPFPNAPTQEQRELSYLVTTRTVYDSAFHDLLYYDDLTGIEPLHRVIAVYDDKGNRVGHYPRPFDVLPVTDVNSIFTYAPSGRLSSSETTERFDGYARRTWRAYDLATGDVTEERVYIDPTHYAATEYAYHSVYPFPVRQTSWQDYNKTGRKIETLFFYGLADGTIDPNDEAANKYLVGQEVFLDDAGSSDPNDWRFAQTTYTYYDNGRVRTVTDPDGFVTLYGYDEYGNQAEVWIGTTDPFSGPPDQRIRYDALGRAVLSTNRRGAVTLSQYDDFGRLCRELRYEDPNAVLITYADFVPSRYFDPNSSPDPNAVGPYDPNEVTLADYGPLTPVAAVYYGYDAKGRRTYERKATGGTVVTTYTRNGLLETVTYDDGSLIQYGYTGTGQKRWEGYDLDGDGFDWDVSTWYDLLDRPTEEVYWAAADSDAWLRGRWRAYWGSGQTALELDYGPGDWTSGCDDERVIFHEYDILGRPVRRVVDPNDGGLQLATEYAYDAAGNRIRTTDPKGRHIHVGYDNANRAIWQSFATEVTDPNLVDVRSRTCYHPNGRISAKLAYDYDGLLLARSDFAYDDHGRVRQVVEWITAAPDPNECAVTEYAYS
ncbi:MAG TPA: hypothetical protein ENN87_01495, partial [Phycisphaerales bacterium]|nr:hypothetical protein [Phycisphaerales bacterium]